jgi:hypothetical protein
MFPRRVNLAARQRGSRLDRRASSVFAKARKERRRRERIDRGASPRIVFSKIAEHVRKRVPSGSRRCQRAPVPSVGPETPSSKDEAVHPPSDSYCETSHSGRERALVGSFDQQVQVIGLHREMHDPKHAMMTMICLGDGAF